MVVRIQVGKKGPVEAESGAGEEREIMQYRTKCHPKVKLTPDFQVAL